MAGGGAKSAAPQDEAYEPDPTSIDEAEQRIAHAKAALGVAPDAAPPRAAPSAHMDVETSESLSMSKRPAAQEAPAPVVHRCASPCRAITSMRRAVVALCRMTGDEDRRCVDAKRTLADSEKRVTSCSC
jgi:hypothetical protein